MGSGSGVDHGHTEKMTGRQKNLIVGILSQLRLGADMTKILIPVDFLEPRSLTERVTDFYTHGHLITDVCKVDNSVDRIISVLKWYLSCWHIGPKGVKKPYNPILGEIYRCNFELEDGSITCFIAEQVSHHPPITALRAENLKYNASVCGWYYPRSRFLGNSAASCAEGHLILDFKNENEKYEITLPDYYARGIIFGKVTMEICGKTYIKCFNSRLRADIEFKSKPFFGGEYGLVEATIKDGDTLLYEIKGKWTNGFSIKKAGEKEWKSFFDCETAPRIEKNIIPRNHLLSNEAHVVWRFLTRAIYEGNVEHAATEKENVEKKQREIQKSREQNKIEFKPTFFKKIEDGKFWEFIGHDLPEYQLLHHKIGSSEYENIRTSIKETPFLKLHPEEENTLPNDNKLQDNKQQTVDESMD